MGRSPSRSRRAELQLLLGDLGEVLPRVARGTPRMPAQGWYVRLAAEERVRFVGDCAPIAVLTISRLVREHDAAPEAAEAAGA